MHKTKDEIRQTLLCKIARIAWKEYHKIDIPLGFEIHHLNKNREDNSPENLLLLCRDCHIHFHYHKLINGKWNKTCKVCGETLPLSEFYRNSTSKAQLVCCKNCIKKWKHLYRQTDAYKISDYKRKHTNKYIEYIREYSREYEKKKYNNDKDFREKKKQYQKEYEKNKYIKKKITT